MGSDPQLVAQVDVAIEVVRRAAVAPEPDTVELVDPVGRVNAQHPQRTVDGDSTATLCPAPRLPGWRAPRR